MKKKQSFAKTKKFTAAPFTALKEIAVPAQGAPSPPPSSPPPPQPVEDDDDLDLFFRAVSDVRPLVADAGGKPPAGASAPAPLPAAVRARKFEEEDRTLFLNALEGLEVRFEEDLPDESDSLRPISASRLKQLKQGTIRITLELDLHGMTRDEALVSLDHFIRGAWRRGMKAVLVITGKGNNSPGEPVLQAAVAGWLRAQGKKTVVEFSPAPRQMGGTGAFVVFLRENGTDNRKEQL